MIEDKIKKLVHKSLQALGIEGESVSLEHPADISHGDYSTNVALVHAKSVGMNPLSLAAGIVRYIVLKRPPEIERIEVAGAGFINFYLSREFFTESIAEILRHAQDFGQNDLLVGKKVMVEYTDPNPFKEFHIGHLMSNAIGESVSRLFEFQGAEVKRACYQGDIGLHVAKAVWGMKSKKIHDSRFTIQDLGEAYKSGAEAYEADAAAKEEMHELNKKIFEKSDERINILYLAGRQVSLEYFEEIYKKLGTKFDYHFFESETGEIGKKTVEEFTGQGVFEKSQGAIIFPGEKHLPAPGLRQAGGLHSRVFINSQGLPTYEAKELGLAKIKYDKYKYDQSVVITGNEVNDYFKVLLRAMNLVFPELAKKTKHLSHGILRLPSGKMSSRVGNVITAESLIAAMEAMVHKKLEERELETKEKNKIAEIVAVGAIKYSILKQAIGSDIVFDFGKSISFEGDSGPYLQYSYVRAKSVLAKAATEKIPHLEVKPPSGGGGVPSLLERLLPRFPEVVKRAGQEYAPHLVVTYLTALAAAFNSYYAKNQIVNAEDKTSPYRVALTQAFTIVMKNGLWLLGIETSEQM
ncbi:MAG: arginine--tRNA ligase [Candidatus Taylorbacteria bacterium]|nr:arginine--tRNA ligase [Candidatus Taylorbacteria bacterium]